MSQKTINITGWSLTVLLGILFTMSAFMKLNQNDATVAQAASLGIEAGSFQLIGIIEIVSLILFIIPRTGIVGTLLLAAYLGGAIATHLEHQQPVTMPVVTQMLLWITAIIRFPELRHRLFSNNKLPAL